MIHRNPFASAGTVILIAFLAAWPAFSSGAEKPENVPNPLSFSGRYVGDGANILGPEYIALIDGVCRALKTATSAEMAVITVRDLGGTTIEDFAEKLFKRLGIGEKGKDNGILILCALAERDVRVEVGYGLEPDITDAKSKRLMNDFAIPLLRRNDFGQGLFALAKATAEEIAKAQHASLKVSDPAAWPAQVALPKIESGAKGRPAADRGGDSLGPLLFAAFTLAWGIAGMLLVFLRVRSRRARAARRKAIGSGLAAVQTVLWLGAVGGFVALLATGTGFLTVLLAGLAPVAATVGQAKMSKRLRLGLDDYHLSCTKCSHPMDLLPEDKDDAFLTVEEAAEEKAGGMDYEIWNCPSCGASERLSVLMNKASACPQCRRRTLTETRATLVAATTSHGGRVRVDQKCLNPKCGYGHSAEHGTPQLSSSSSSGSGSRGSSHSSFGGGRSGGGGSTGHF
jgi:uncharacterized membrane protein YgcG